MAIHKLTWLCQAVLFDLFARFLAQITQTNGQVTANIITDTINKKKKTER